MVDNRGISPVSGYFNASDGSSLTNKMSEEKMGQGGEYFAQEMAEEETQEQTIYQDRSAQLRASLNGLAMANAGSIMLMKTLKEKEESRKKIKNKSEKEENPTDEIIDEAVLDE